MFNNWLKLTNQYKKENDDPWKLNKIGLIKFYSNRISYNEVPIIVDQSLFLN